MSLHCMVSIDQRQPGSSLQTGMGWDAQSATPGFPVDVFVAVVVERAFVLVVVQTEDTGAGVDPAAAAVVVSLVLWTLVVVDGTAHLPHDFAHIASMYFTLFVHSPIAVHWLHFSASPASAQRVVVVAVVLVDGTTHMPHDLAHFFSMNFALFVHSPI